MGDVGSSGACLSFRGTVPGALDTKGSRLQERPEELRDVLHRVAGSVYVASDLIGRAVEQYVAIATSPDRSVVDKCTEVGAALADVAETLETALRADRLGPAA